MGTACSSFGGIKRNMGTMTKPYHCGRAAEGGVRAALLAKWALHHMLTHLREIRFPSCICNEAEV